MMKKRLAIAAVALALVTAGGVAVMANETVTVGQFIQQLARTMNLSAADVSTAVDSLERAGVRLPAELNYSKGLTEGDVATIGRSAGLNLRTGSPDAAFSQDNVDRFFVSFGEEFVPGTRGGEAEQTANAATDVLFDPFNPLLRFRENGESEGPGHGKGKGKGKGGRTPTDPD
jgi:hypothetical protein